MYIYCFRLGHLEDGSNEPLTITARSISTASSILSYFCIVIELMEIPLILVITLSQLPSAFISCFLVGSRIC